MASINYNLLSALLTKLSQHDWISDPVEKNLILLNYLFIKVTYEPVIVFQRVCVIAFRRKTVVKLVKLPFSVSDPTLDISISLFTVICLKVGAYILRLATSTCHVSRWMCYSEYLWYVTKMGVMLRILTRSSYFRHRGWPCICARSWVSFFVHLNVLCTSWHRLDVGSLSTVLRTTRVSTHIISLVGFYMLKISNWIAGILTIMFLKVFNFVNVIFLGIISQWLNVQ